jgi:hypothetical protein
MAWPDLAGYLYSAPQTARFVAPASALTHWDATGSLAGLARMEAADDMAHLPRAQRIGIGKRATQVPTLDQDGPG